MQIEINWKKTLQKSSNAAKINQIDHFLKPHIHQVYVLQQKMKGKDKFASLFYLSLYLSSSIS